MQHLPSALLRPSGFALSSPLSCSSSSLTTHVTKPLSLLFVPHRFAHARKRQKKRKLRRLGYTSYSKTGERTTPVQTLAKKKDKKKNEEEEKQIFRIPEGNTQGKVDISNPMAVRQNLHDILKAPVSQPIGNTRELKPSSNLGLNPDIKRKEDQEKEKAKRKEEEKKKEEEKVPPKRKSDEEEEQEEKEENGKKKIVFSDRKDYIQHQIKILKERVEKKDKNISAHRFSQLFKEKSLKEEEATKIFDIAREAKIVDLVLYNSYITYFVKHNKPQKALGVLDTMDKDKVKPNLITWNIFIDLFCREGLFHEAIGIFDSLRARKLQPEVTTCNILISYLAKAKKNDLAMEIYGKMRDLGVKPDIYIHNTIIKMYVDSNQFEQAQRVFQRLKGPKSKIQPDRVTYSILIDKLAKDGKFADARDMMDEMKNSGLKADAFLYTNVILALGKAGKVDSVTDAYDEMLEDGIQPNANVYHALLDAYKRNGKLDKVKAVEEEIKRKNIKTNSSSYATLVEEFVQNAEVEKGIQIVNEMKSKHMTPSEKIYTSLYNIIPISTNDAKLRGSYELQILLMMKSDDLPPFQIFEGLIRTNLKPDSADADFGFFFGLFERNNYKPDLFFVNAFMEVLAVRMGMRGPAYDLLSKLVSDAQRGEEKLYDENTFEIMIRAFTIADEFDEVVKVFQLWSVSSLKFVETTCVPALIKLVLAGRKDDAKKIITMAQKQGANAKKILEGLDHILAPTTHQERAERERDWMAENMMHPGQVHIRRLYELHEQQKVALKGARKMEKGDLASKMLHQHMMKDMEGVGEGDEEEEEPVVTKKSVGRAREEGRQEKQEKGGKEREKEKHLNRLGVLPNVGPNGGNVGPNVGPKGGQVGPKGGQVGPKGGQVGPKGGQVGPKGGQVGPKGGQVGPKGGQVGPKGGQVGPVGPVGGRGIGHAIGAALKNPGKVGREEVREKRKESKGEADVLNEDSLEWYQKRKKELKI
eukprot:Phypoly_transcript_02126.p1 GENE.Phypoly_transcript_02126~~Phypoly_transcript_02126.p1  ORF type:complete len:982 (+),score=246.02 Phypoly_transcript_02126:1-2946(+)